MYPDGAVIQLKSDESGVKRHPVYLMKAYSKIYVYGLTILIVALVKSTTCIHVFKKYSPM